MAVSCQWMFIVLSCAVEMFVAARPSLRILADSSAGALGGVGGTARSLFGSPPSCSRLPPLPGASSLRLDRGARPAVADAPEYPQESAVAAARRRTFTPRGRELFDRRELPRCSWPACRSRGDGPPRPATRRDPLRVLAENCAARFGSAVTRPRKTNGHHNEAEVAHFAEVAADLAGRGCRRSRVRRAGSRRGRAARRDAATQLHRPGRESILEGRQAVRELSAEAPAPADDRSGNPARDAPNAA